MHRENALLFHLSPEGRGRANEESEGEGVRKLGIFLMRPSPLTPPSPLWGEGVHDRREDNFAHPSPLSRGADAVAVVAIRRAALTLGAHEKDRLPLVRP